MRLFIPLSFIFLFTSVLSAQPELKFVRYKTKQGLVHNDVLCLCQDKYGFMWFGTKYGCSRFDGVEFKSYEFNDEMQSNIGTGWTQEILLDKKQRLWIARTGDANTFLRYDYLTEQIIDESNILRKELKITEEIFPIYSMFEGNDGMLYMGSNIGLVRYDPDDKSAKSYRTYADAPVSDLFHNITLKDFFQDEEDNIWIVTNNGLFIFNVRKDEFRHYSHNPDDPTTLSSNQCNCVFKDSKKQIWIGTYQGLNKLIRFEAGMPVFEQFTHNFNNPDVKLKNIVYDIEEDAGQNLLIATVYGLYAIEKNSEAIYAYYNKSNDSESINSNLIRRIYKDNLGNIWFGTNAGVGKLIHKNFKTFTHSISENNISHNKVDFFYGTQQGLYIANPNGIDLYNYKTEKFQNILKVTQNADGLYGAPIVMRDIDPNEILIGTWNGGVSKYNISNKKLEHFKSNPALNSFLNVFAIKKDNKQNIWLAENRKGVYCFEDFPNRCKIFSHDPKKKGSISSNFINDIIQDNENNIWIATNNGLNKVDNFQKGTFHEYFHNLNIICIEQSIDNFFWLGTDRGLYKFFKKTGDYLKFDMSNGLPGNIVFGILEDNEKNIWIATNNGFAKASSNSKYKLQITIFRPEDGVDIGDYLSRSCEKLEDGRMVFGGTDGFFMFHPSQVKTDTVSPRVALTELFLANKSVRIGQEINSQIVLSESVTSIENLVLNHKNNAFKLKFAGLHYNFPQYFKFAYRLDGYDPKSEWNYTHVGERDVEYMNLPDGDYIFQVKAANSYGTWSKQITSLNITILPPFWKTFWFSALMTALFSLLILFFIHSRTRNLQKQKLILEEKVEKRTRQLQEMNVILGERKVELEQQADQMQDMNNQLMQNNAELKAKTEEVERMANKIHESDQKQLRFYANISHEFRTPLTLISAPLEKCLQDLQYPSFNVQKTLIYLQLIKRNVKRLLRLVNQIIDFRKIDQGYIDCNYSQNNISNFIEDIIDVFSLHAQSKGIQLKVMNEEFRVKSEEPTKRKGLITDHSSLLTQFWFDPDILEKILYNLISNAIKYTPQGGEINIQLRVKNEELRIDDKNKQNEDPSLITHHTSLIIKIIDTGIGIKPDDIDKIFDRFYRVGPTETYTKSGAGIGLAFTKELIELHRGEVFVESTLGEGTCFTLYFPMNLKNSGDIHSNEKEPRLNYTRTMLESDLNSPISPDHNKQSETFISEVHINETIERGPTLSEPSGNPLLLLAEDNVELREFIKSELQNQYTIHAVENGEEAWEMVFQNDYDIIVSDIMMPVMNGIELCEKLKNDLNTSHIPIIILTAKTGEENILKGLLIGANDYITKPFNISILQLKIHNTLLLKKNLQEKFISRPELSPSEITTSVIDEEFLQKAIQTVRENMKDQNFGNDEFVQLMNHSRALVYRKLKNITGQTVSEFIQNLRIKEAANLFLAGYDSISDVCYLVGFKHASTFSRYFSKVHGIPPREFIKNHKTKKDTDE